jgi:hypothetical protein
LKGARAGPKASGVCRKFGPALLHHKVKLGRLQTKKASGEGETTPLAGMPLKAGAEGLAIGLELQACTGSHEKFVVLQVAASERTTGIGVIHSNVGVEVLGPGIVHESRD